MPRLALETASVAPVAPVAAMTSVGSSSSKTWCCIVSLLFGGLGLCERAFPQTASPFEAAGKFAPTLSVRAANPLRDDLIKKFAASASARVLPRESYPDLPLLSSREVISVLCGSFRQAYWDELRKLNPDPLAGKDPDSVLGLSSYAISWPACPLVLVQPKLKYVVKVDDTAFDLYRRFTGGTGSPAAIETFFKSSGIADVSRIKPGQILVPSHVTFATPIQSRLEASQFASNFAPMTTTSGLGKACNFNVCVTDLFAQEPPVAEVVPRFNVAAGRIQMVGDSQTYEAPQECGDPSLSGPLFKGKQIVNAYEDALKAVLALNMEHAAANVTIADNGFFGARLTSGKLTFGPQFPERFFATHRTAGDGQIGPLFRTVNPPVSPLNYLNNLQKATFVSGHGTHVTGLVIGGADFQPFLSTFDRALGKPWLHLWIINVGKGQDSLIPNSSIELSQQLNARKNAIINLSIQYTSTGDVLDSDLLRLQDSTSTTTGNLFVVSAGNDKSVDVRDGPYYPAMLGGITQSNIITVAAHLPDGSLARFSNRGSENVDLAAPGCNVASWLDESGSISRVSGTSQAAAIVTFASALLKSLGNLSPREIKNRLIISGDPLRSPASPASTTSAPSSRSATSAASARSTSPTGSAGSNGSSKVATQDADDPAPPPAQVYSRAKLNVARALHLFDDYVSFRDKDNNLREVLGVLQGIKGIACPRAVKWRDVWALKQSDEGFLLYRGKQSPESVASSPCLASIASDAALLVKIRAVLDEDGVPQFNESGSMVPVPLTNLEQFVAASKPYRN